VRSREGSEQENVLRKRHKSAGRLGNEKDLKEDKARSLAAEGQIEKVVWS